MGELNTNKLETRAMNLDRDIRPTWNLVGIITLLVGSVIALIVFTAMTGRYVPTGSVVGFQGPSYFYITGLWGFIISGSWIISFIMNLKRVRIAIDDSKNIIITETYLHGKKDLIIPIDGVSLITCKRFPSAGNVAWLVVTIGWTAFILQFAVPTFQLPFMSVPVTGTILVIFATCVMITSGILVMHPGMKFVLYDATARHVISFPGINDATAIMQKINSLFDEQFIFLDRENHATPIQDVTRGVVNLCWITAGIVNVALLIGANTPSILNQGSAWAFVITGFLGLLEWRNRKNSLLSSSSLPKSRVFPPLSNTSWVSFWLDAFFVVTVIILMYFFGRGIAGVMDIPGYEPWRAAIQAMTSALYLTWIAWMGTLKLAKISVPLGSKYTAILTAFSTKIVAIGRIIKEVRIPISPVLIRVVIYTILGFIFLILGFSSV